MASLPHDASGFLVGERLVNGIDLVGRDTTEILKILKSSIGLQQASNNRLRVTLDRINNQSQRRVIDVTPTPLPVPRIGNNNQQLPTVDIGAPTSDVRPMPPTREHGRDSGQVDDARPSNTDNPRPTPNENANGSPTPPTPDIEPTLPPTPLDDSRRGNGRRRNARGQFEGDNAPPSDDATPDDGRRNNGRRRNSRGQFEGDGSGGLINGIRNAIRSGFALGNADTQNIDPTVDAVRELGDLMSPLAKVGKTMFKGAAWLFRRKKKREEPSDQEQRQQSRIEKLLKRIAGSRVGQAAGSGVNLFGGLFSSLTGTVGGALRFIPALISSIFSPIASVFRVVPSLIMGAIAPIGRVLTSLAPMLMRFLPIALGVTAVFKLGEWVGGKIYDAISPKLGDAIDWSVDAYKTAVAKTSAGIEAGAEIYKIAVENMTDNMEKTANGAKYIWETGKGVYKQAIENTADNFVETANGAENLWNGVTSLYQKTVTGVSNWRTSVAEAISPAKKPQSSFTQDKAQSIKATADRLGVSPNDLAQVISFESGGSFDPAKKNMGGSGATGLIQFMPNTAKSMGTTTQDLEKMPFDEQMKYVEKYFVDRGIGKNGKTSIADMYNAVQGVPKSGYKAGTKAYDQNKAWDVNKDGVIMPNEAVTGNGFMAHAKDYYPVASATTTKVVAPAIPTTVPKLLARPLPETPKVKQQVSTKEQKPMQVSVMGGNESIGQNVSDRHLAHAVTGGLGMDALRMG